MTVKTRCECTGFSLCKCVQRNVIVVVNKKIRTLVLSAQGQIPGVFPDQLLFGQSAVVQALLDIAGVGKNVGPVAFDVALRQDQKTDRTSSSRAAISPSTGHRIFRPNTAATSAAIF